MKPIICKKTGRRTASGALCLVCGRKCEFKTAVMLGGILGELEIAIGLMDDVNGQGEVVLRNLITRLESSVYKLNSERPVFTGEN